MKTIDKSQKYALFFDIDGTLYFDNKITQETINTLNKVKQNGHYIFLNTGRSRGFLPLNLITPIKWDGYVCGASYAEINGKIILIKRLTKKEVAKIIDFCFKYKVNIMFEGEEKMYEMIFNDQPPTKYTVDISMGLKEFKKQFLKDYKNLKITKATFRQRLNDEWLKELPVDVIHFPHYSEAFKKGYNKATGMLKVAQKLKIPKNNIVAFGDSLNDYDMLINAGISVVMEHSPEEIKSFADVVLTGKENAVANGLKDMFL